MSRPYCIVFAGVNGAGKSTFYHSQLWRQEDMPKRMMRVNPDEILREAQGRWDAPADQIAAGKVALARIDQAFSAHTSLNFETTLTGHGAIKRLARAHSLGYRTVLYYIGVSDVEVALERIEHRVEMGGHSIDADVVQRRFSASLSKLCQAIPLCDEAHAYDNTIDFRRMASWDHDVLCWWGAVNARQRWLVDAMCDEHIWAR